MQTEKNIREPLNRQEVVKAIERKNPLHIPMELCENVRDRFSAQYTAKVALTNDTELSF